MWVVDRALRQRQAEGRPLRVGMVGAGFMGRGIARQILQSVPGMALVAIASRRVEQARRAYTEAGAAEIVPASTQTQLDSAIARGTPAITDDPYLLCRTPGIEALIEVTGSIEYAAGVVLEAIAHGKDVVLMNAELDGTLGPILQTYAQRAGTLLTACDGDQPGVQMNLFRFVRSLGLTPLLCGNVKGLHDRFRTPTTQAAFARRWGQNPRMVTSFADGTKISFEQAIVANGTGFSIARRGMLGLHHEGHVDELTQRYDPDRLREWGGIVDYVVGAQPGPGVFVLATHDDPVQRHYLNLYKLGPGPLYSFYTPYHLCHFEVPLSVARAVLFRDAVLRPISPRIDVVATAKRPLHAGETLDDLGGYDTYGQCERAEIVRRDRLLPMGLAPGCRLLRPVPVDRVLTYDDVTVPPNRLCDRLRAEQDRYFSTEFSSSESGERWG